MRPSAFALRLIAAVVLAPAVLAPAPLAAQSYSIGYQFLEAVRERDGNRVIEMLGESGATVANSRDTSTGRTALHIVTERRDLTWINFLLQRGADPRIADRAGVTPLRIAAELGFVDGARALLSSGAGVNAANRLGETALHVAVQRRDAAMVRMLMAAGADADLQDSVAGKSARDYASEDSRGSAILAILNQPRDTALPAPTIAGPAGPN